MAGSVSDIQEEVLTVVTTATRVANALHDAIIALYPDGKVPTDPVEIAGLIAGISAFVGASTFSIVGNKQKAQLLFFETIVPAVSRSISGEMRDPEGEG